MAERLEVVFLGTGSPLPSPDRCGAGNVLVAGGQHVLVDCGWGAARRLLPAGIMASDIDTAVFTHMHTDHITDVPDFLFLRWTSGATQPLRIFGPEGTQDMVDGFLHALRRDIGFRLQHHGEKLHPDGIKVEVTEIPATPSPQQFQTVDGLTFESFEVNHFPVVPAFGYRFRFDGRSVVMSGDTTFCESLLHASEGADLLVCEALNVRMLSDRAAALRAMGRGLQASLFEDVPSYHIPTEEVAALAQRAGVRKVALSHLIPPIPNQGPQVEQFVAGMSDVYKGPIHVARDMERLAVEPRGAA
ncbi:MAG TPA: MBL fold metallo-hydrolase [Tepidiformaceae bacterium]|nr:MBL fold metallo-hydrolase [Tepidiformaceae bacterium]